MTNPVATVNGRPVYSVLGLSSLLGVNRNTITQWLRDGCPYVTKADRARGLEWQLDPGAVVQWREARVVAAALGDSSGSDLEEAKRRKVAAEATLAELDVQERLGKLVPVEAVAAEVARQYMELRQHLLGLPSKVAPLVALTTDPAQCKVLLDQQVYEALEALAYDRIETATAEAADTGPAADEPGPGQPPDRGAARRPARRPRPGPGTTAPPTGQ